MQILYLDLCLIVLTDEPLQLDMYNVEWGLTINLPTKFVLNFLYVLQIANTLYFCQSVLMAGFHDRVRVNPGCVIPLTNPDDRGRDSLRNFGL